MPVPEPVKEFTREEDGPPPAPVQGFDREED